MQPILKIGPACGRELALLGSRSSGRSAAQSRSGDGKCDTRQLAWASLSRSRSPVLRRRKLQAAPSRSEWSMTNPASMRTCPVWAVSKQPGWQWRTSAARHSVNRSSSSPPIIRTNPILQRTSSASGLTPTTSTQCSMFRTHPQCLPCRRSPARHRSSWSSRPAPLRISRVRPARRTAFIGPTTPMRLPMGPAR